MDVLRIATAGSVDDGKSTLIGRLMFDSKVLMDDQLGGPTKAEQFSEAGVDPRKINLAFFTDGLKEEQSAGITIDVAYRYFSSRSRRFVLADSPGHFEFTRNMVTAASNSEVMILLIDVVRGLTEQTKRHLLIAKLLGLRKVFICVNKMDSVGYKKDKFECIWLSVEKFINDSAVAKYSGCSTAFPPLEFIPISALLGENVVSRSEFTPWYQEKSLSESLETYECAQACERDPVRVGIQWMPEASKRILATVLTGRLKVGDDLLLLPNQVEVKVERIDDWQNNFEEVAAPKSMGLHLSKKLTVKRGDLFVRRGEEPFYRSEFIAKIFWMSEKGFEVDKKYQLKMATQEAVVSSHEIVNSLQLKDLILKEGRSAHIDKNAFGTVRFKTKKSIFFDAFKFGNVMGAFILVDPESGDTCAGGTLQ